MCYLFLLLLSILVINTNGETMQEAASYSRYLVQNGIQGVFATQYSGDTTYSFASAEDFAESSSANGYPIFLLADISETATNLKNNPKGSFSIIKSNCSVSDYDGMAYDPLACYRVTLMGEFTQKPGPAKITDPDFIAFASKHPAATDWLNYSGHEFNLWTFNFKQIHCVGGYGNLHYIGPIDVSTYLNASPVEPPFN